MRNSVRGLRSWETGKLGSWKAGRQERGGVGFIVSDLSSLSRANAREANTREPEGKDSKFFDFGLIAYNAGLRIINLAMVLGL